MDDSPNQIDTPEPENTDPSFGERAADAGRGLKNAASSARDAIGGGGGSGDGISSAAKGVGNALKNAAGSLGGGAGGGLGKSMDGIKGAGGLNKTPNMFKGMEGDNKPHGQNNTASEKSSNPSAADFAKKAGANAAKGSSAGQKAQQMASDAIKTARDAQDVARIVGTGGTDAAAWADLAKRFASHPIEFTKRYGRVALYAVGFIFLQFALVFAIAGVIFFGIYKVYLTTVEAAKEGDFGAVATSLRVNSEMATWLAKAALQLSYERAQEEGRKPGVVLAQEDYEDYNLSALPSNPEIDKLHETWSNAGLAATFLDEYNARLEPNGSARQVDSFDPAAWTLYVNDQNYGTLNSSRAKAFVSIFASETTHWDDVYTRANYKATARKSFGVGSFRLELPDSESSSDKSDQIITQQLVNSTLKPIEDKSGTYYDCLISGEDNCTTLGLGSQDAPNNNPDETKQGLLGGFFGALISRRNDIATRKLDKKVNKDNLGQFTQSISDDITPRASEYDNKDTLDAAVRTGSSETILQSVGKADDEVDTPDPEALLELYKRFDRASENGNYARVNYDRQSRQSVALASTYFTAGGQLLNNELGLLDSWSLTKNLSVLEESPAFRAAVIGKPVGVFAQEGDDEGYEECQSVYDDQAPIGKVDTNTERPVQQASCFRRALIPNEGAFAQEKNLKQIYKLLEQNNDEYDSSVSNTGGIGGIIGRVIKSVTGEKLDAYRNKSIRTSPIAAERINLTADLGPEFDAYTNQVYGVAKTGAEINGDAYDAMAMAAQSIWTQSALDEDFGIGARYLNNEETAEIVRYARNMEREKLALKPFAERLLSLKTPDSLAGKLALLTPTNRTDGTKKTLALFKTDNLTGAVAARMTPTTLAQASESVNIFNGVAGGYPLGDPSNTMNAGQLWNAYDCGGSGVEQDSIRPDGIPFDIAGTTNPCKRESVVAKVASCYLDTQAQCDFEELNAPAPTGAEIDDRGADTSNTPCAAGSTAERLATLQNGSQIKLCDYGSVTGINASWSADVASMLQAASGQIELSGNAYRDGAQQIALRKKHCGSSQYDIYQKPSGSCRPPTAIPGRSNHEYGLAIDFRSCSNRATACYQWLAANAGTFNIKNYPDEAWHWSFNGS